MTGSDTCQVLLISPAFFGYEIDIAAELDRQGFETTLIDERPSNSTAARAIVRVRKDLIGRQIDSYYRRKLTSIEGQSFSLVLVVKAEVVPKWFLTAIRNRNPDARFVFYSFDAIQNSSNCLEVLECFDRRLSFDPEDVATRPDFEYLPLFHTREFSPLKPSEPRRHSISFVGTLHSDRYRFAKRIFARRDRTFGFFFVQARWYFALLKYFTRQHRQVPWSDVAFESMTRAEIAEVFRSSAAVLDMQRPGQTGMTMRTFEVLASGAALITTNDAIVDQPFFDPSRIMVVPEEIPADLDVKIDEFLRAVPRDAHPIMRRYSLESWVAAIVSDVERSPR